jgi:hypothetical protein
LSRGSRENRREGLLGELVGEVRRLNGLGASEIVVLRPPGVAARVRLKGWASQLTFDDQTFGAVGSDVRLQSPGYEDATGRYDVEVSGSASDLTLTTSPG